MKDEDRILEFIKREGPVLPSKIAKLIKKNILISSAYLSELSSRKKIFISNTKIGGSPVYYAAGQETKLQDLFENLSGNEKRCFELLKEQY